MGICSKSTKPIGGILQVFILSVCFPLWLLGGASDIRGQEYYARGQIDVVTKSQPGDGGNSNSFGFYVESMGNAYKVRIEEMEAKDRYYEYAYRDGIMKWVHHVRANIDAGQNVPPVFPVRIEARRIPPNDGTRAQFVWFALVSHRYFAGLTNVYLPPIWSPEDPKIRRLWRRRAPSHSPAFWASITRRSCTG